MTLQDKLYGCLVCGAVGDSIGGRYKGCGPVGLVAFDFDWA